MVRIMKVVLNKRYGGLGIGNKALYELIKINSPIVGHTCLQNDATRVFSNDLYEYCSFDGALTDGTKTYILIDQDSFETRSHPDLVNVVEKLGEESWGLPAKLVIEEHFPKMPNIDSYDGYETIDSN